MSFSCHTLPPFCFPAYFSCLFSLGVLWVWLQCSGTAWWSMNSTESGKCCTKSFPTSSSFWERSYDCRPCITEVGMITPCSRTFHTGLQYFEPTLLAVISEFELQRSWNQYQLLSSQNLSFRGAEITFTAKEVTNPSLAKVFKRKGCYIHQNRRKSGLSIKGVSKIVLIFYVRFLWSVQERIAESPSLQARLWGGSSCW